MPSRRVSVRFIACDGAGGRTVRAAVPMLISSSHAPHAARVGRQSCEAMSKEPGGQKPPGPRVTRSVKGRPRRPRTSPVGPDILVQAEEVLRVPLRLQGCQLGVFLRAEVGAHLVRTFIRLEVQIDAGR